jgi:hypothetical protein
MKVVREYPLALGTNALAFPASADLLSVVACPGIKLFASVEAGADHNSTRHFTVVRSLQTVDGNFVGSVLLDDGVAHVFDEGTA